MFDAPDCAVALWVRAGAWAARNLTDGFVPSGMPARLCDDADTAVRELVRRKLWLRVKDGFRFHDWTKYQPTRESVEHDREQATERKRRERERRRAEKPQVEVGRVTQASRRDSPVTTGVTHGAVTAPRPDPTRPNTSTPDGVEGAADAAQPAGEQPPLAGMPTGDPSASAPKQKRRTAKKPPLPDDGSETGGQRVNRITRIYTDRVKLSNFMAAQGVVRTALRSGAYTDEQVIDGLNKLADNEDPLTNNSLRTAIKPPSWISNNQDRRSGDLGSSRHRVQDSHADVERFKENI